MIKAVLLLAAAALAACAKPAPPPVHACPAVPECRRPQAIIHTNADLAHAYLTADAALAECKLARDTLAACIFHHEKDTP